MNDHDPIEQPKYPPDAHLRVAIQRQATDMLVLTGQIDELVRSEQNWKVAYEVKQLRIAASKIGAALDAYDVAVAANAGAGK